MSDDAPLKSAYELAMERLQARDREAGVEKRELTDEDRRRIGELRERARAKLAEMEILHAKDRAAATDPDKLRELEEHYEIDRRRLESRLEDDVERLRRGG